MFWINREKTLKFGLDILHETTPVYIKNIKTMPFVEGIFKLNVNEINMANLVSN